MMDYQKYRNELEKIMNENPEGTLDDSALEQFTYYLRDCSSVDSLKLFRYSGADYYNIRNFETGQLRLTNNGVLNDVYEGIPLDGCHDITLEMTQMLSDLAFLKCFSESQLNTLMWSHYADEHRGFCVEYDLSLIDQTDDIWNHLFPVVYSSKRRIATDVPKTAKELHELKRDMEDNSEHCDEGFLHDITALFLTKGKAWSYENEWRIIYTQNQIYELDDAELNRHMLSFDYASNIYLGYRICSVIKENIIEIVKRINDQRKNAVHMPKISVYQMKLSQDSYDLECLKIYP